MNWQDTNLSINDLDHYRKLYEKVKKRNSMNPDATFRATVGRFVNKDQAKAIDNLLAAVKGQGAQ